MANVIKSLLIIVLIVWCKPGLSAPPCKSGVCPKRCNELLEQLLTIINEIKDTGVCCPPCTCETTTWCTTPTTICETTTPVTCTTPPYTETTTPVTCTTPPFTETTTPAICTTPPYTETTMYYSTIH
ncbi:hypothetical protein QE152_g37381 [Popillia japonica]|uniref:Uncharacterized protein n=1 Tax=Popillia japonica TaxID=7064 RepID=A0AAW1IAU6_POPJA